MHYITQDRQFQILFQPASETSPKSAKSAKTSFFVYSLFHQILGVGSIFPIGPVAL